VKSFTYSGVWWLPSQEEHKVTGEATFSGDDETKLVLHGAFAHDFVSDRIESLPWYPIILGITAAGQPITLLHCQEMSFGSYTGENGEGQEQECNAEIAYVGSHFTDPQEILFNKVDVHYSYLPQWTGLFPYYGHQKPFDEVSASTTKGTITVQPIQSVWNELTKKTDLINQADLSEIVRIRCEVQEALLLDEWMTLFITPLQHLISLATQRPNAIVNIVGYIKQNGTDRSKSEIAELPVQIAFIPAITPIIASRGTVPETILFSLQEIMPNFSRVIETWLHMADELESTFRLFFGVQYTNLPLDLRFLLTAQAVEVYQDHRFGKAAIPKEEYQVFMETILAACPEEKREWLAETLQYSNHATFRQQLRNFVTQTNAVLRPLLGKNSDKRGEFTEVVYNTRNYLTHHTKELAPKAASGVELFYITRCLSLALQVCLMKELGFAPPKLTETMQKHEHYQHISFLQPQVDLEKLAS
jgi:hypothetical protein